MIVNGSQLQIPHCGNKATAQSTIVLTSMILPNMLVAFFCGCWLAHSQVVLTIPPLDYNYSSIPLPLQVNGNTRIVQPPFPITFGNGTYSQLYISSCGYLSFSSPINNYSFPEFVQTPMLLIGPNMFTVLNLTVFSTPQNLTIHYSGYQGGPWSEPNPIELGVSDGLEWYVTFYNSTYQHFAVSIKTPNYSIRVCSSLNCAVRVVTKAGQSYGFLDCGKGFCFDVGSGTCVVTTLLNCAKCNGTLCLQCSTEYQFDDSGSICSQCGDNFTLSNGSCVEKSARCVQVSPQNPETCLKCLQTYTGFFCTTCMEGYRSQGYLCLACEFDNCAHCTYFKCIKCLPGCHMDMGTCYTKTQYRNRILALALGIAGGIALLLLICFCLARQSPLFKRVCSCFRCHVCCCCKSCIDRPLSALINQNTSQKDDQDKNKRYEDNLSVNGQVCAMCLSEHAQILTDCKHYFHAGCINAATRYEQKCPVCHHRNPKHSRRCFNCNEYRETIDSKGRCNTCPRARLATEDNITQSNIEG